MPTRNVLVEDSVFINENFAVGSEMSGGVQATFETWIFDQSSSLISKQILSNTSKGYRC